MSNALYRVRVKWARLARRGLHLICALSAGENELEDAVGSDFGESGEGLVGVLFGVDGYGLRKSIAFSQESARARALPSRVPPIVMTTLRAMLMEQRLENAFGLHFREGGFEGGQGLVDILRVVDG
jgi:hypothetical protein